MEHAKIARRVQALLARARHLSTPPHEAAAARAKADELTTKYNVRDSAPRSAPETPPTVTGPTVVHRMEGFTPSGARYRAWCRCGYGTSARASEDRALRALVADHHLDAPECVLCGIHYDTADWLDARDRLVVLEDPATGDEFTVCRDLQGCLDRT